MTSVSTSYIQLNVSEGWVLTFKVKLSTRHSTKNPWKGSGCPCRGSTRAQSQPITTEERVEGPCHGEAALRQHRNVGDNHVPEPPAKAALSAFLPGHQWTLCFPLRLIPSETLLKTITSDCLSPSVRNTREKASISVPSSSTSSLWLSYSQDIQTIKLAGLQNILSILFSWAKDYAFDVENIFCLLFLFYFLICIWKNYYLRWNFVSRDFPQLNCSEWRRWLPSLSWLFCTS